MKTNFFLLFLLVFLGCSERQAELEFPDAPAKIVLDGYISPHGSSLFITSFTPSGKILDPQHLFLNDAQAILFLEDEPIDTFMLIDTLGHFELGPNDKILEGKIYRLMVSSEGLSDVVVEDLLIPKPIDSMQMIYEPMDALEGSIRVNFDVPDNSLFYCSCRGYDSIGIERDISSTFFSDVGDCPATWTLPRYICESRCFGVDNPRLAFDFSYVTQNHWFPVGDIFVNLHRIRYSISRCGERYRYLLDVQDGFDLGYKEPNVTESNVKGGYGVVLPLNISEAEVVF